MAFTDFDVFTDSSITATLDTSDPIIGAGSLLMASTDGGSTEDGSVSVALKSGFPNGFSKGRISSLFRINRAVTGSHNNNGPGFYFLSDNTDISTNPSTFYWAGLLVRSDLDIVLAKVSSDILSGFAWATQTIAESTGISVIETDIIPFQVEWNTDADASGGTRIILSVGNINDTDFDNLSTVIDYVDVNNRIESGVAEGIGWAAQRNITIPSGEGFTVDKTTFTVLT